METISELINKGKRFIASVAVSVAPSAWKEFHELSYWKRIKKVEGSLSNEHYKRFYTTHFGLEDSFYEGKVLLDIGCGPRGSLEWASMASRRMGIDPLANKYLQLGASRHNMEYINSPAEKIPLEDGVCDVVFSFNSLDHVENIEQTLEEVKRVTRSGGLFLVLVEVNHPPTDTEPHELTPMRLLEGLGSAFVCEELRLYQATREGMYRSIDDNQVIPNAEGSGERGFLSGRFLRV